MSLHDDFFEEEKQRKKRGKKKNKNKKIAHERDLSFIKLLQDQQILHFANCNDKYALHLIQEYTKQELNYALVDDLESIWENQSFDKDLKYRLAIIRIFSPEHYQTQRREFLQGNIPDSSVNLNDKSRYIMESLIISALELPYRIWPYWKNINEMTLPSGFDYWNQRFARGNDEHFFRGAGSIVKKPLQRILKTAEELGAKPVPKKQKKYWVELKHEISYPDDNGQTEPAKNTPYIITFPDGKTEKGTLDSKGKARHDNLKTPGQCTVEYEPDTDKKIKEKQAEIKTILDNIIKAEQQETQKIEKQLSEAKTLGLDFPGSNALAQYDAYKKAARKGAWKAAKGMGEMAYDASQYLNPITAPIKFSKDIVKLKATYDSLKNISDEDIKTYSTLMGDADTYNLFMDFSENYVKAQHSLEITEAGGMVAFEIAIIVITAGVGATASVRHIGKLKKLKFLLDDLVKLLKRKRARKEYSGDTNTRLESKNNIKSSRVPESYINRKYTIDMRNAPDSSARNAAGFPRNGRWFWRENLKKNPTLFSDTNKFRIRKGKSPIVDEVWIRSNPTHESFMGEKLIHHHIDQGAVASALPEKLHQGWDRALHPKK